MINHATLNVIASKARNGQTYGIKLAEFSVKTSMSHQYASNNK